MDAQPHSGLSANARASGQEGLSVCASICRNFHSKLSCRAARGSTTDESQMAPCLRHSAICRQYSRFTFCLRHNPRSYCLARPMSVRHCVQARPAPQPPSGAFIVKKTAAASQGRLFYLILLNCTLKIFSRTPQITLF